MTDFLLHRFVKDYENIQNPAVHTAIGKLSGTVGIACNVLLFLAKLLAGILTGSVSIMADAVNNLSDASSSVVTLIGFKIAAKPADSKHPYGHARVEYMSGLLVSAMILMIGYTLAESSLDKILHPAAVEFSLLSIVILVLSILVKFWMNRFNVKLGNYIHSTTLLATAADSRNDCISTAAVLAAALAEHFLPIRMDGLMGLAVAVFILKSGWGLAKDTISPLLGEAAAPELRQKIVDYVAANPMVLGYHDLMVHDYGPGRQFASMHVEMDHRADPLVCHEIIDDMERECYESHGIQLVIHYDPVVVDDPELTALRERVRALVQEFDPSLNIHDFRMVRGERHTNLIFDVSMPAALSDKQQELTRQLTEKMNENSPMRYCLVITYDLADYA